MLHLPRVPTKRPRHAITETPEVQGALDELRQELGDEQLHLPELVILGAAEKLRLVRAERERVQKLRRRLADRIGSGEFPFDPAAAAEVRSRWVRE